MAHARDLRGDAPPSFAEESGGGARLDRQGSAYPAPQPFGGKRKEARPILFDLTHLVSRLPLRPTSGIDRIDLAYAAYFAGEGATTPMVHYGLRRPHLIAPGEAAKLVRLSRSLWDADEAGSDDFRAVRDWLATSPSERAPKPARQPVRFTATDTLLRRLNQYRGRLLNDHRRSIPEGAIYLNVAQHVFEQPFFFRWLDARADLCPVFMIHDLLPLDYPEYFRASNLEIFRCRIATAIRYAQAFLVSSRAVSVRLEKELRAQGAHPRPIHAQPFPSPLSGLQGGRLADCSPETGAAPVHPYFVMLGMIEPRKNHHMMLQVWRRLAARSPNAPRLVIVGARGWESEQTIDLLDRSEAIQNHVLEITGLPSADLVNLIRHARGLLAPSFNEGYGLPVVEALSLGTPVVASDIPVFRETSQGKATFLGPLDGLDWLAAIERLASDEEFFTAKRAEAASFAAPCWPAYFEDVEAFLASL